MPRAAQINRLGAPAWPSTEITLAVQIGGYSRAAGVMAGHAAQPCGQELDAGTGSGTDLSALG
jgi:hypothetical protein